MPTSNAKNLRKRVPICCQNVAQKIPDLESVDCLSSMLAALLPPPMNPPPIQCFMVPLDCWCWWWCEDGRWPWLRLGSWRPGRSGGERERE